MLKLTITKPDDWHIHLRNGQVLADTVRDAARQFARAIIMPNLVPPVTTVEMANVYRRQIVDRVPSGYHFNPLMTLYLTDHTSTGDIKAAMKTDYVKACKLYPAGATTNSESGLTNIKNAYPVFEAMEKYGMPLLIHGEVTDNNIDIFDREKVFIDQILKPLTESFPALKIVLEHITTSDAVDFVNSSKSNIAATITAHHLLNNRNDMLVGGIHPHLFCLPILKRQQHQQALITAATSGSHQFFLGTDSAPHAQHMKESACGCAGCYTAYSAIELYAETFDEAQSLDKLEGFASFYGADFYGLPRNEKSITLIKKSWRMPEYLNFGTDKIIPYRAGELIQWQVK